MQQITVPKDMRGYLNRLKSHGFEIELYFSTTIIAIVASKPNSGVNVWINGDQSAILELNYEQTILSGATAIDDAVDRALEAA